MDPAESAAPDGLLRCPSPVSSHRPLISHQISEETCQLRQGELYHKCFTCANSGLRQARFGQLVRERILGEGAPILKPPAWPPLPDAKLATGGTGFRARAAVEGSRP